MAHKLIIKSLHDAQADCSCGRWHISCTGERTREELEDIHKAHVKWEKTRRHVT